MGGFWGIYELLPAFFTGILMIVVISLFTEKPSDEIGKEFELARSEEILS